MEVLKKILETNLPDREDSSKHGMCSNCCQLLDEFQKCVNRIAEIRSMVVSLVKRNAHRIRNWDPNQDQDPDNPQIQNDQEDSLRRKNLLSLQKVDASTFNMTKEEFAKNLVCPHCCKCFADDLDFNEHQKDHESTRMR